MLSRIKVIAFVKYSWETLFVFVHIVMKNNLKICYIHLNRVNYIPSYSKTTKCFKKMSRIVVDIITMLKVNNFIVVYIIQ